MTSGQNLSQPEDENKDCKYALRFKLNQVEIRGRVEVIGLSHETPLKSWVKDRNGSLLKSQVMAAETAL